jgi:hypothetical protein
MLVDIKANHYSNCLCKAQYFQNHFKKNTIQCNTLASFYTEGHLRGMHNHLTQTEPFLFIKSRLLKEHTKPGPQASPQERQHPESHLQNPTERSLK